MGNEMIVYGGNVIKIPGNESTSRELATRPAFGAGKNYIEDKRPRTLQDECFDLLTQDPPIRPRIAPAPEPKPKAAPKAKPSKPVEPETNSRLDDFHSFCWHDDEVTVSNMKIGTSGREKSITVTLSTSDSYRFTRLLESFDKATAAKPAATRKRAARS